MGTEDPPAAQGLTRTRSRRHIRLQHLGFTSQDLAALVVALRQMSDMLDARIDIDRTDGDAVLVESGFAEHVASDLLGASAGGRLVLTVSAGTGASKDCGPAACLEARQQRWLQFQIEQVLFEPSAEG